MKTYCTLHDDCRENADIAHACASERAVKVSDVVVKRDKEFEVYGEYGVFLSGKRVATIFRDPSDRIWYAFYHMVDSYCASQRGCRSKSMHGHRYIGDTKKDAVEALVYTINRDQGYVDEDHWRRAVGRPRSFADLTTSRNPIESSQLVRAVGAVVAGLAIGAGAASLKRDGGGLGKF
jgi:hypothetical protein